MTPYTVWIITPTNEYPIFGFVAEIGLSDNEVVLAAKAELQAVLNKLDSPGPDSIEIRNTILFPTARQFRHQENSP